MQEESDFEDSDSEPRSRNQLLHPTSGCCNLPDDIAKMSIVLASDPLALERREPFFASELTPLQHAVCEGHDKCVQFLLEAGADVNVRTRDDRRDMLELAITGRSENVVPLILKYGLGPSYLSTDRVNNYNKSYYLGLAVSHCENLSIAELLVDSGAVVNDFVGYKINFDNMFFYVPAVDCVTHLQIEKLKFLLLSGMPVDFREANFEEPPEPAIKDCLSLIHHAVCGSGHGGYVKEKAALDLLFQFGANLWEKNRLELTPLQMRSNRKLWNRERSLRDLAWYHDRPNEGVFFQITEYLKELMAVPMSLTSLCRLTLFKAIGQKYMEKVDLLPTLPTRLKSFLRWENVPDCDSVS